jgi:predicted sugar kinase
MNEFDNFVDDGKEKREMTEQEKAWKRCEEHIAELNEMAKIGFMNIKPELSEVDKRILGYLLLANIQSILKMEWEVEKKAKQIRELVKEYEKTTS